MVTVNETRKEQFSALLERCAYLNADVRPCAEQQYFTVTIPPPWCTATYQKAQEIQDKIKEWSKQYPNAVCYCFDCYSTLVYVL